MALKAFGRNPSGEELAKVEQSPNYKNGVFHNLSHTAIMAEDGSMLKASWKFFTKPKDTKPPRALPSVKTDLKNNTSVLPVITWFGHSSYLIQVNGKNILVDPVFSGYASPFIGFAKSFDGSDVYSVDDMPAIDILLITHDHYDHLDYKTVIALKNKTTIICTSLGVKSHFIYWGFNDKQIKEFDWWEEQQVMPGIKIVAAPSRHFSGRGLTRFKTLWSSFVLQAGDYSFYIGADSGYDTHFKEIGNRYGPFDIALLETGQYNEDWRNIHMMPEEAAQAALDLKAKVLMPVHWAKFSLALHPWNEPANRVTAKAAELGVKITTPMIGEPVIINNKYPDSKWWLF